MRPGLTISCTGHVVVLIEGPADIPDLVGGAVKQQRLLAMAPRDVMPEDLEAIFGNSIRNW